MRPIEPTFPLGPDQQLMVFGVDRPDVDPLPAVCDAVGHVISEWTPDASELERLMRGAPVRVWVSTYGHPLQPLALEVGEIPGGPLVAAPGRT